MVASLLVLALALVLLAGLGNHDLWAPDEPRYGQVAREMITGGDWLLPHVNQRIYTDKPPGWFWCAALLSLPGGDVTAFSARLPSALAALILALMVAAWGERRLGAGSGVRSAVVMATIYMFFELGRSAHLDALLALLITTSLLAGYQVITGGAGFGGRLIFWLAAGLSVLVKGPVGLVLILLVAAADRLLARRPRDLLRLQPWWGLALAAALPVGWLLLVGATHPGYDALGVIDRHVVSRFGSGLHHARPFWYYGPYFFMEFLPWSFLVPAAAWAGWSYRVPGPAGRGDPKGISPDTARRRFLVIWLVTIVVFFSISKEKRGIYIMPVLPPVALLLGDLWRRLRHRERFAGWAVQVGLILPAVIFLAAGSLPWLLARRPQPGTPDLPGAVLWLAIFAVAGGLGILVSLVRRHISAALNLLAATGLAVLLVYAHGIQPAMDPIKSARGLAQDLVREAGPDDAVGMLVWRARYLFYSGIVMEELGDEDQVVAWASRDNRRHLLLVRAEAWGRLAPRLPAARQIAEHGSGRRHTLLMEIPGAG
jgi:4-amino-4-deoxy-L-arabinose transferase-like glycosyltransferase